MKKKALLLMLFCMFISTNALSQVSCGAPDAVGCNYVACDIMYEIDWNSCPRQKSYCKDEVRYKEDQCIFGGLDFTLCSLTAMREEERCDYNEGVCRYDATEKYLACIEKERIRCEED